MDGLIRTLFLGQLLVRAWRNALMFGRWIGQVFLFFVTSLATALANFWSNVPAACGHIAEEWVRRATDEGFPTIWDETLYHILWIVAFLLFIVAWICLSWLTLAILRWIFR